MLRNKLLLGSMILAAAQTAVAGNTLADYKPGFYLGGQAGYAQTDYGSGPEDYINQFSGSKEVHKDHFGGRFFIGWSILPYLSVETGIADYPANKYKVDRENGDQNWLKYKDLIVFDLMAKGILPLELLSSHLAGWNVYAKAGVAIVSIKKHYEYEGYYRRGYYDDSNDNKNYCVPAYGLGIGYNFTDHFGIDLSWSGIYSSNKPKVEDINNGLNKNAPSANLIALGASYKF